ncbi:MULTISPECIES: YitT family protein [Paenibacillus]|uniref:YitT family protein n=1 Tax=Paenibacillus TaxID=44249 RepID=UPI0022B8E6EF|nr:YitT family protein [Paenibacillus caseinilyticus]MCZ8518971.1 YitT family protein [Paenibacillus caseinilyticus]
MRRFAYIVFGCMVTAMGLLFLKHTHAVTGGTAGLSLNLTYLTGVSFTSLFLAINIPFFLFSALTMGRSFTLSSIGSVLILTLFTGFDTLLPAFEPSNLTGAIMGGMGIGLGVSILFANNSSLGGANILAFYLRRKYNWDPGLVNFLFDGMVVLISLSAVGLTKAVYSIGSIALASLIISYFKSKINSEPAKSVRTYSIPEMAAPGGALTAGELRAMEDPSHAEQVPPADLPEGSPAVYGSGSEGLR